MGVLGLGMVPGSSICGGQARRGNVEPGSRTHALWQEPPIRDLRDCSAEFWFPRKHGSVLLRVQCMLWTSPLRLRCREYPHGSPKSPTCFPEAAPRAAPKRTYCAAEVNASACKASGGRSEAHPLSRDSTARAFSRCRRQESRWTRWSHKGLYGIGCCCCGLTDLGEHLACFLSPASCV